MVDNKCDQTPFLCVQSLMATVSFAVTDLTENSNTSGCHLPVWVAARLGPAALIPKSYQAILLKGKHATYSTKDTGEGKSATMSLILIATTGGLNGKIMHA